VSNGSKARLRNTLLIALAIFLVGGAAIAALNNQLPSFGLFNWGSNRERVILSGNIEAHESVLSFKTVQSRIIELPFDEGQWVRKGDLIARLDDSDYQQNVKTARATLDQSKQQLDAAQANVEALKKTVVADEADLKEKSLDYKRVQHMFDNGATSAQSRDLGETAFKQSQAAWLRDQALQVAAEKNVGSAAAAVRSATENLKLSEIILGYTVLRAPFDGVILTRQAEIGEVMLPSAPVVTLADLDHVWLRAYVNETDIGKVKFARNYHDRHLPEQKIPGAYLGDRVARGIHAQKRRNSQRARDARLSNQDRRLQSGARAGSRDAGRRRYRFDSVQWQRLSHRQLSRPTA